MFDPDLGSTLTLQPRRTAGYTPLGMLGRMEPTLTNSSTPNPTPAATPTVFGRLRALFGGQATDGSLGSKITAERALDVVQGGATLLDVRDNSEWKSGHSPGAIHVALGEIDKAPRRLPQGRPVVVMCASGMRSRTAAKHLRGLGWDAASLSGGIRAWARAGGAVRR
jgi:rhodanese-related sulfurtransferase